MTQKEQIIRHLKIHGSITFAEAWSLYLISNLRGRIWELREMGYKIISANVKFTTRLEKKSFFVRYEMRETADEKYMPRPA